MSQLTDVVTPGVVTPGDGAGAESGAIIDPIAGRSSCRLPFVLRTVGGVTSLVMGANAVGALVTTLLIAATNTGVPSHQRAVVLTAAGAYEVVSFAVGATLVVLLLRRNLRWLTSGVAPTRAEAQRTLRTPVGVSLITGTLWMLAAVGFTILVAGVGATADETVGVGIGLLLAGLSTAAFTYLVALRAWRPATVLALAVFPPGDSMTLSVRSRLLLSWALTTGVPVLGIVFVLTSPPGHSHVRATAIATALVALLVGVLSTGLAARAIGSPLQDLLAVLRRVGRGDLDVHVAVEDTGEIGLLQGGINEMVAGLRERDRIQDLFGRHVGPAVARDAVTHGVTLSGETRDVVALFVDITGSTALTRRMEPAEFVAMLNRFFEVVVEAVEASGGLVNKFEGDAALCLFGAPVELDDAATAALCAARQIRDRVQTAAEVDVGIGVAAGPVIAGQIGAASRLEYTVIGDAVNEAARLTDLAKAEVGGLLASEAVMRDASAAERAHWHEVAEVVLRGRGTPTRIWVA